MSSDSSDSPPPDSNTPPSSPPPPSDDNSSSPPPPSDDNSSSPPPPSDDNSSPPPPSDSSQSPPPPPDDNSSSPPPSSPPPSSPPPSSPPPPSDDQKSPPPPSDDQKSPPPPDNDDGSSQSPPPPPNNKSPNQQPPPPPPPPNLGNGKFSPPPPRHELPEPSPNSGKSNNTPSSSSDGGGGSGIGVPAIIGIAAGAGLLLLVAILLIIACSRRKKKSDSPVRYFNHSADDNYFKRQIPPAAGPNQYGYNNNREHVLNIPPPPGAVWGGTLTPPPPPPPQFNSSEMSTSSYSNSGPHGPVLPPPHPSVALGFNQSSFTFEELSAATGGFTQRNLLGQGGFGYVHKGFLPNGKEIAVKSLKSTGGQGDREFQAEVDTISRVHHRHLVSLVGYCISDSQKLLVYEFVPNKTLEYHLHGHPRIIHRDIKAANILIENNLEAKARPVCVKVIESGNFEELVDPRLEGNYNTQEIAHMVACASACVRHSAKRRPRMSQVVRVLEGDVSLDVLNHEGVKPGQSTMYSNANSGEYGASAYLADMKQFRKLALESGTANTDLYGNTSEYGLNLSASSSDQSSAEYTKTPGISMDHTLHQSQTH
ncbi:unnamed protein product [Lupinus luteus]|uniref:non-specific serine/threonine protein kinase n=1 Tax=Lupinus luteus TaxID=3873 RepID=A0AAV1XB40_LUPLU